MNLKAWFGLVFGVLLLSGCPFPGGKKASEGVMEGVQERKVGVIRVIHRYMPETPVSIRLLIDHRGGGFWPGEAWLALQTAQLGGSKSQSSEDLSRELHRYAAKLDLLPGPDYHQWVLNCLPEFFAESWDVLAKTVIEAQLEEKNFILARERLKNEIREQSQHPARWTANQVHPQARSAIYGDTVSHAKIDFEGIKTTYFRDLVQKGRLTLVVSGGVEAQVLDEQINRSLALLPEGNFRAPAKTEATFPLPPLPVFRRESALLTHVRGAPNHYQPCDPRSAHQGIALRLLTERLRSRLITTREPVLARAIDLQYHYGEASLYLVSATPVAALHEMQNLSREICQQGFSEEEVREMGERLYLQALLSLQSSEGQTAWLGLAVDHEGSVDCREYFKALRTATAGEVGQELRSALEAFRWAIWGEDLPENSLYGFCAEP